VTLVSVAHGFVTLERLNPKDSHARSGAATDENGAGLAELGSALVQQARPKD
jgi:hypothetical protein